MRMKSAALFLTLVFCLAFFFTDLGIGQQDVPEKQSETNLAKEEPEKIIPAPKNIKESTGIYVFVAWIWVAIFVLIYIVRQKIKEVDRLFQIKFFSTKKK